MPIPSIYINLEDDVSKVVDRIKRVQFKQVVLVCPKRCQLFADSINLRLLKKQTDLLGKEVHILTMDERGQLYAKEAGFPLKSLLQTPRSGNISDIRKSQPQPVQQNQPATDVHYHAIKKIPTVKKVAEAPFAVSKTETYFPSEIEQTIETTKHKAKGRKLITSFVALSLAVLLLVIFVILPQADVTVYAKKQPVARDLQILLSTNQQSTNASSTGASFVGLPATKISETLEVQSDFSSQGKKEVGNKAVGDIQIYNFTRTAINLKANTTTLTAGGKTYALSQDVVGLKPTGYRNNQTKEVDPSTLGSPVAVQAAAGGESYNIPAGTRLEISNQVFGSKTQVLYAKTVTAITGGTSRYISTVADQDTLAGQTQLGEKLIQQVRDKIAPDGLTLVDGAYSISVVKFATDKPVGTESPNFHATLNATVSGLAFNSDKLKQLVLDRIGKTLATGTLQPHNFSANGAVASNLDLNTGTAILTAHFEGDNTFTVNLGDIAPQLEGKTQNQAVEILMSKGNIEKIDITIVPSWQKTFPHFANKIHTILIK